MEHLVEIGSFSGLTDLVAADLRGRIMSGEIAPGAPLRQRDLALLLGVSREPIKLAVALLAQEGLVLKPPRRSAIVAPITRKLVHDVYEVRTGLDAIVTRSATRLAVADRTILAASLDDLVATHRRLDGPAELAELDRRFHLLIYEAAGNQLALATYRSAWNTIGRAMGLLVSSNYYNNSWAEHVEIIEAIRAGDVGLAGARAEDHCQRASEWLLEGAKHLFSDASVDPEDGGGD